MTRLTTPYVYFDLYTYFNTHITWVLASYQYKSSYQIDNRVFPNHQYNILFYPKDFAGISLQKR